MQSTFRQALTALTTLAISGVAGAETEWAGRSSENLRPGVTQVSQDIYDLHMAILWICTAIGGLVVVLILWSSIQHRKSKNPKPADFHENIFLEILWTVIPFIILILMAIPATRVLVSMDDTEASELTVKVTGYRWNWSYEYLSYQDDNDIGVSFFSNLSTPMEEYNNPKLASGLFPYGTAKELAGQPFPEKNPEYMLEVDNHLVIPAGQKVRFLLTADDVIHSFWVPDFGIKKDAIPGFINESWAIVPEDATGFYRGQCAELCGKGHAFMPIVVEVKSQEDFQAWLAEQKEKAASGPDMTAFASLDEAMTLGQEKYKAACAVCHGANGEGGIGPAFAGTDLATNPERRQEHIDILVNGRNAMPSFKAQLSPRELAAVITYERNAFGNETGDLVQPADVHE